MNLKYVFSRILSSMLLTLLLYVEWNVSCCRDGCKVLSLHGFWGKQLFEYLAMFSLPPYPFCWTVWFWEPESGMTKALIDTRYKERSPLSRAYISLCKKVQKQIAYQLIRTLFPEHIMSGIRLHWVSPWDEFCRDNVAFKIYLVLGPAR